MATTVLGVRVYDLRGVGVDMEGVGVELALPVNPRNSEIA